MPRRLRTPLLLALLAFACAQGWNRANLRALRGSPAHGAVREGGSLITTDDASYLQEADRLLGARPDLDRQPPISAPRLRAPGYGVLYLVLRLALPPAHAIAALVALQCLLYAIAVAALWGTLARWRIDPRIRWPLVLAFAMMPTFHGFLFHTLTEGITPSLLLLLLCCALRHELEPRRRWLAAGVALWAALMAVRPPLLWAGAALLPALRRQGALRAAGIAALAAAPMLAWWAANAVHAHALVGLHPVYYASAPGINRPTHAAFWELAKSWGARGDAFHGAMERAFAAALACDTAPAYADAYIALAPRGSLTSAQERAVRSAFGEWQRFTCTALAPARSSAAGTVHGTTAEEQAIIDRLAETTRTWRAEHPLHHHVAVPLRVLRELAAHSNLNLWVFQHPWRGHPAMEALRWSSALLHLMLLAAAALAFLRPVPAPVRLLSAACAAYLLYLAGVQRGVEERYTLPVLYVGVAAAAFVLQQAIRPNFADQPRPR